MVLSPGEASDPRISSGTGVSMWSPSERRATCAASGWTPHGETARDEISGSGPPPVVEPPWLDRVRRNLSNRGGATPGGSPEPGISPRTVSPCGVRLLTWTVDVGCQRGPSTWTVRVCVCVCICMYVYTAMVCVICVPYHTCMPLYPIADPLYPCVPSTGLWASFL